MRGLATRHTTMRSMLEKLGVKQSLMKTAIQFLMIRPQSSDSYATGVQLIVRGLQRTLKRKGHPVRVTGWIDEPTDTAISKIVGSGWNQRTWMQIIDAVLDSKPARRVEQPRAPRAPLSGHEPVGGVLTEFFWSPTGLLTVGALAWYLARRR